MKLKRILMAVILAASILIGTAVPAIAATNPGARHLAGDAWNTLFRISTPPSVLSLGYGVLSDHLAGETQPSRQNSLAENRLNAAQLNQLAAKRTLLETQAKEKALKTQAGARAQALAAQAKAAAQRRAAKIRATAVARARVVSMAKQYLGVPYVWAGTSPRGFDCSGFVLYVYNKLGVNLPHFAASQYTYGHQVSRSQLQPGDLVFFYRPIHHVGIYIGSGLMINARGARVQIEPLWGSYSGATRLIS